LLNFIARRLVVAMFQLVGLVLVVFFAIRMLPADPVARLVGMNSTPEAYRMSQQALGLDKPVLEQLRNYIVGVPGHVHGLQVSVQARAQDPHHPDQGFAPDAATPTPRGRPV